tara:strand:+ start:294 stop:1061 length:768 start_codon:yes stop_codon:yes gene_type:complete
MNAQRSIRLGCTMLGGTDKLGVIKPIDDGYYRVPVGAYNAYNSVGMFYDLNSAMTFFGEGSPLMRQIKKGVLHGEYKHPVREPHWSDQDYIRRIKDVDADRESHHIRNVELIPGHKDEQGRPIVLVVAEIKPSGPFGHILKEKLENRHQNVYFSVRSLTMDDNIRGVKYTRDIITWDFVTEGGIYSANKFNAPGLESYEEVEVTQHSLLALRQEQERNRNLGLEDNSVDYGKLLVELGWDSQRPVQRTPRFINGW